MDLNWFLQQLQQTSEIKDFNLYWNVDPGDEQTPGWTAEVKIDDGHEDGGYIIGVWNETPKEAYEGLISELIKEGFIEESQIYGR